jgi:N6-L-threonylcarbamoyladenine synthase
VLVLGIESTCDETACAVVKDGREILSNVISSQIDLQRAYGGVVPELACRRHIEVLIPVIEKALTDASVTLQQIDLIAVAYGPGLIGALMIGVNAAKALAWSLGIPFVGVNHVEAHLYAALMSYPDNAVTFPCLGVVASGGHTALVKMQGVGEYELIGHTVDDAIGEAFDKVAKILDLPYPGGPVIEELALEGDPKKYPFRSGQVKEDPFAFSFSGLKTSVLYAVKGQSSGYRSVTTLPREELCHVAASFQRAALGDLVEKTVKASHRYGCRTILLGGGVTNNKRLREMFIERDPTLKYLWPSSGLSLDNAAMIGGLGYHVYKNKKEGDPLDLEACTSISLGSVCDDG